MKIHRLLGTDGGARARMRVHWVSPLPPARTDIAHFTERVLPALAERADVVLWTDATDWEPALEAFADVRHFDPTARIPISPGGMSLDWVSPEPVFLHLGNAYAFHSGPALLARRVPTCVVLHDLALQELFDGMIRHGRLDGRIYEEEIARWYGVEGRNLARRVRSGEVTGAEAAEKFPGFEAALGRAISVLCHSEGAHRTVAGRSAVPSYQLELPYGIGPERPAARTAGGPLRLIQFGYMGKNRLLSRIVDALSRLASDMNFILDIYGIVSQEAELRAQIAAAGLEDRVLLHGFVPEAELDDALARAHFAFNLRNPTVGEASGGQLRIWNASAASVVSDQGWYADLPNDCVLKLRPNAEPEELADLIRFADRNRRDLAALGANGRKRLVDRHAPDIYADGIMAIAARFAGDVREGLLVEAGRRLLDDTGNLDPVRRRLAAVVSDH